MGKVIVFVDGENFMHKVEDVVASLGIDIKKVNFSRIQLNTLIRDVFHNMSIDKIIYYSAKLHNYPQSTEKSKELIGRQRSLKTELEKQGIEFILSGNVRAQQVEGKTIFKERGRCKNCSGRGIYGL